MDLKSQQWLPGGVLLRLFWKFHRTDRKTDAPGSLLQWSCRLEAYLVQVLSCEFFETFKNIYFANVCEGLPVKSKIFTGVSFRKVLSFYYKRNRQLLYYERTSSYILLKISERVNRVIFQNSSELLLLKIPQQAKTCSKSTTKECFSIIIRVSF